MRYADSHCTYTEDYQFVNGKTHHTYTFTGKCVVTGKQVSVTVPGDGLHSYRQGASIQDAFPALTPSDREFLISGISAEGWDQMFGDGALET